MDLRKKPRKGAQKGNTATTRNRRTRAAPSLLLKRSTAMIGWASMKMARTKCGTAITCVPDMLFTIFRRTIVIPTHTRTELLSSRHHLSEFALVGPDDPFLGTHKNLRKFVQTYGRSNRVRASPHSRDTEAKASEPGHGVNVRPRENNSRKPGRQLTF